MCDYHIKKIVEKVAFNLKFVPASAKLYIYGLKRTDRPVDGTPLDVDEVNGDSTDELL